MGWTILLVVLLCCSVVPFVALCLGAWWVSVGVAPTWFHLLLCSAGFGLLLIGLFSLADGTTDAEAAGTMAFAVGVSVAMRLAQTMMGRTA